MKVKIYEIDSKSALVSFEHPEHGYIERECSLRDIPEGAQMGDVIEMDASARPKTITVPALVEWLDTPNAIVSFLHPRLGACEREFPLLGLPEGINGGDEFDLIIELDKDDGVCGYNPQRGVLRKRTIGEWEKIPEPQLPDPSNTEEMQKYEDAMREYLEKTSALRIKSETL